MRHLIILAAALGALLIGLSLWLDEGEVITLVTTGAQGHEFETGLWIVDIDGVPYLRAESPGASWLARIRARPEVQLERAGSRAPYRATPLDDAPMRDAVNRAMAEKYGQINRALILFRDHTEAVPIRLQPRNPADPVPHRDREIGAVR